MKNFENFGQIEIVVSESTTKTTKTSNVNAPIIGVENLHLPEKVLISGVDAALYCLGAYSQHIEANKTKFQQNKIWALNALLPQNFEALSRLQQIAFWDTITDYFNETTLKLMNKTNEDLTNSLKAGNIKVKQIAVKKAASNNDTAIFQIAIDEISGIYYLPNRDNLATAFNLSEIVQVDKNISALNTVSGNLLQSKSIVPTLSANYLGSVNISSKLNTAKVLAAISNPYKVFENFAVIKPTIKPKLALFIGFNALQLQQLIYEALNLDLPLIEVTADKVKEAEAEAEALKAKREAEAEALKAKTTK